jgi:hypothetical protein
MSQVRFSMGSLGLLTDCIFPAALWTWGQLNLGVKVLRADNLNNFTS